jgi:hypothetical protein
MASGSPNSNRPWRDNATTTDRRTMGQSSVAAGAIGRPSTSHACTYARTAPTNAWAWRLIISTSRAVCRSGHIYTRALLPTRHGGRATSLVVGPRRRPLAFGRGLRTSRRLLPARPRSGFFPSARRHTADAVVSRAACGNNNNDSSPPASGSRQAKAKPFILA